MIAMVGKTLCFDAVIWFSLFCLYRGVSLVRNNIIFASPHGQGSWVEHNTDPKVREVAKAYFAALDVLTERQAKAFEKGVSTARVVRLPGAHHYVYLSNEADVLREMRAFLAGLH